MLAGWTSLLARTAFKQKFEQRINEPKNDMKYFALDHEGQFVGVLQLAEIDHYEKRAVISIFTRQEIRECARGESACPEVGLKWDRPFQMCVAQPGERSRQDATRNRLPGSETQGMKIKHMERRNL